jgi:transposase-like protein
MRKLRPRLSRNKSPRKKRTPLHKRQAVENWINSGKSAEVIGHELGITANRLYAWRSDFGPSAAGGRAAEGPKSGSTADLQSRLDTAERELARVREQRDILKKTLGILSEPPASVLIGLTR